MGKSVESILQGIETESEPKEKRKQGNKKLYQKWWFWLILLAIIVVIGFITIILYGFNIINPYKNLTNLAKDLQEYDNNITVYQSAEKNTIIIKDTTQTKDEATEKSTDIGKIIGKYIEYLSIYDDIEFLFYTEDGNKLTFVFDIKTRDIKDETMQEWILQGSQSEHEQITELENQISKLNSDISQLNSSKSSLTADINTLETQKTTLNTEIESLKGDVVKVKGEPRTYPAGHLTVGTDVPTGKYKIYDGKSNFVVHSSTGSLEVNTILGGNYGANEYVYTFKTGDKIEADSSFKLVQVQ